MNEYAEVYIPLSYLSQYYYCPRRAALLMLEQQWADNTATTEGILLHERAHEAGLESRPGLMIARSVYLHSEVYGLSGMSDVVELHADPGGAPVAGLSGLWRIVPVEYKRGTKREELEYKVQLCAQAICLEEELSTKINTGFLYYGGDRRRLEVALDEDLRLLVAAGVAALRAILASGVNPHPVHGPKCRECSVADICLPAASGRARAYLLAVAADAGREGSE